MIEMSDLLWRFAFIALSGLLIWVLHRYVGAYPEALPRSKNPASDIRLALLLWAILFVFAFINSAWFSSEWNQAVNDPFLNEAVQALIRTILYLLLPLFLVVRPFGWQLREAGLAIRTQSWDVTIFAIVFGLISGSIPYFTGQSNISIQILPLSVLLLLFYSNAFLEEFAFRGVIQSLLDRSLGQGKAILWGGILFGLTHVGLYVSALAETGGVLAVLSALVLQTQAGWLFGIIFMKTRSLWSGIVCHYLANWLSSLLAVFAG